MPLFSTDSYFKSGVLELIHMHQIDIDDLVILDRGDGSICFIELIDFVKFFSCEVPLLFLLASQEQYVKKNVTVDGFIEALKLYFIRRENSAFGARQSMKKKFTVRDVMFLKLFIMGESTAQDFASSFGLDMKMLSNYKNLFFKRLGVESQSAFVTLVKNWQVLMPDFRALIDRNP